MGRRRKTNSINKVRKKVSEGRGMGTGEGYVPGIFTYEIPSKGKVARVKGMTDNRTHHCLSQIEKHFLILLDNDPLVTEIYEQKTLPLEDTLLIAADLGYEHPRVDGYAVLMTTDFYFLRGGKWYAVAIKSKKDASKERVKEKLKIERIYWEQKDVLWSLVTEKDIPRQLVANLQWLSSGEHVEKLIPDLETRQAIMDSFLELYRNPSVPFRALIEAMESFYGLRPGTIIQVFKHLIREEAILLDLTRPINWQDPRNGQSPS